MPHLLAELKLSSCMVLQKVPLAHKIRNDPYQIISDRQI